MKYAMFSFILLSGCYGACAEDVSVYVDTACSDAEIAEILRAFDYVNDIAGDEVITFGGFEKGIYEGQDPLDRLLCVPSAQAREMCWESGCALGQFHQDDIYMASYLIKDDMDLFRAVLLHEIGHRLMSGTAADHSDDPSDLMYHMVHIQRGYTRNDKERIF